MTATTFVDWAAARAAVAQAGPRLTSLLRSAQRAEAPALGDWDVTEVAIHVSHAADTTLAMTKGGGDLIDDIWSLSALSGVMINGEGRRPLHDIADRIDATVAAFLAAVEEADPGDMRSWLVTGTQMPVSGLACQLLNELTVHGLDIARAEGRAWPVDRAHATLILQGYLFRALDTLGRAMVVQQKAGKARARFEVRLRGDGRAWLRFCDGDFSVEAAPQGPVDCHLSVDPAAFMLVAWGRRSQWPAIARGQFLAWGRKPWLGPQLRAWLRNP